MARVLAFYAVMFGGGFLFSLYAAMLRPFAPSQRVAAVGQAWGRMALWALRVFCGLRVTVAGAEHLPRQSGALIAAQHQSTMDILVWLTLLPRPVFVLKRELTRIPLFGGNLLPAGMIAVDRAGGAASLRAMVADCQAAIAAGRQIVIFPEGTRVAPGVKAVLQPGIVALARALGVTVIPAATDSGRRWGRAAFAKVSGEVRVEVFAPLPAGLGRDAMLAALAARFYGG